ncbi:hypothetical protein D3C73_550910 [compost metagenome]
MAVFGQVHIVGVPHREVRQVGLAEQYAFGMTGSARGVERHTGCFERGTPAHQRLIEVHVVEVDRIDVQTGHLAGEWMIAVMQQKHSTGVLQDVLLTLQRMTRLQRQIHRTGAQNRQNARIQRAAFRQADTDDACTLMRCKQRLQFLSDGPAVSMQLTISERSAGDAQRGPVGRLKETVLQAFDHWHLCKLLQTLIRGGIEPMDEGEALKKQQALHLLERRERGRFDI